MYSTRTEKATEVAKLLLKVWTSSRHSKGQWTSFALEISQKTGQVHRLKGNYVHLGDFNLCKKRRK